ncbi:MAG: nucleoside deaminase, partial [Leptolyngbyaceae bacterium]|nr:nucleoside deaminase [Leptolyngbyaceae bacterium]
MRSGKGGPYGAVVVKDEEIIAKGCNEVTSSNDPTAHAELIAIREACKVLNSFQLTGCELYTSCEPCPMCLGAILWAKPDRVYYANTKDDAAEFGFKSLAIYQEYGLPLMNRQIPMLQLMRYQALATFQEWGE